MPRSWNGVVSSPDRFAHLSSPRLRRKPYFRQRFREFDVRVGVWVMIWLCTEICRAQRFRRMTFLLPCFRAPLPHSLPPSATVSRKPRKVARSRHQVFHCVLTESTSFRHSRRPRWQICRPEGDRVRPAARPDRVGSTWEYCHFDPSPYHLGENR